MDVEYIETGVVAGGRDKFIPSSTVPLLLRRNGTMVPLLSS